jgi:hypothetical protein
MPLRPSTPVLARHASTEEDLPYVELQLHFFDAFCFLIVLQVTKSRFTPFPQFCI